MVDRIVGASSAVTRTNHENSFLDHNIVGHSSVVFNNYDRRKPQLVQSWRKTTFGPPSESEQAKNLNDISERLSYSDIGLV